MNRVVNPFLQLYQMLQKRKARQEQALKETQEQLDATGRQMDAWEVENAKQLRTDAPPKK